MVEAGLTATEALRTATSIPAAKFGLKDRGSIHKGLQADLLLVNGDPTSAIEDAVKVEAVWRNGEKLDRQKARAYVDEVVEAKNEDMKRKSAESAEKFAAGAHK